MQKILVKGLGMGNTDLSIRLWIILATHEFDMVNIGLNIALACFQSGINTQSVGLYDGTR